MIEEPADFECLLLDNLVEFLRHENFMCEGTHIEHVDKGDDVPHSGMITSGRARRSSASAVHIEESFGSIKSTDSSNRITPVPVESGSAEEIEFVKKA